MKKIIAILLAAFMVVGLFAACGNKTASTTAAGGDAPAETTAAATGTGAEIAVFVSTQSTGIDDRGFAQISWETTKAYGDANGKTYAWYQPADSSVESYLETVQVAVNNGAKVGIFVGFQFLDCAAEAQWLYPDVSWIAIDVSGVESQNEKGLNNNMYCVNFLVQQATFIQGASAVIEGYTNIGDLDCYNIIPVSRWNYGFIQGVNWAAKEYGVEGIKIKDYYIGNQDVSPENQALAASWYETGCDLIFANAAGANVSIYAAAEAAQKDCMTIDTDCWYLSEQIISSGIKDVANVINSSLDAYYSGNFPGGTVVSQGLKEGAVGIPFEHARYKVFTEEMYNELVEMLSKDEGGICSGIIDPADVPDLAEMWSMIPEHNIELQIIE